MSYGIVVVHVGWRVLYQSFQRNGPVIFSLLAGRNLLYLRKIWVMLSHSSFSLPLSWRSSDVTEIVLTDFKPELN